MITVEPFNFSSTCGLMVELSVQLEGGRQLDAQH